MTSTPQANSKTAEFARLFDLFDRIATRRAQAITGDTTEVISTDDIANVPAEFAPVLKNLSMILSSRARRDEERAQCAPAASTTQPCRDNPATENPAPYADMEPSDQVKQDAENPTFPFGKRYPFTFKLMLHKLYDLDEWAEKVKNAVEASKQQFKPLAERVQNVVRDATARMKDRERGEKRSSVHPVLSASAKFKPQSITDLTAVPRDKMASIKERGEKRSIIRPTLGASAKFKLPSTMKHLCLPATMTSTTPEANRTLKKRCIRRRKSINGPMPTSVCVYDAAISATEAAGQSPAIEITLSASREGISTVESCTRHRSLTALENIQTRDTTRRKVKIAVPLLQEEGTDSVLLQRLSGSIVGPVHEVGGTESVMKRKRSVASVFTSESCKRAAVKRPLCV